MFSRKPQVSGVIKYFNLEDWWFSLSDQHREQIKSMDSEIDSAEVSWTSQTESGYFSSLIHASERNKFYDLIDVIVSKALKAGGTAIDRHFVYQNLIVAYYRQREENPNALDRCLDLCLKDIANMPLFKQEWQAENKRLSQGRDDILERQLPDLPNVYAYDRAIKIYETQGKLDEAYNICQLAIEIGHFSPDSLLKLKDKHANQKAKELKLKVIELEKAEKFEEAIKVCEEGIRLGLSDGTKSGFEGRLKKLSKKAGIEVPNKQTIRTNKPKIEESQEPIKAEKTYHSEERGISVRWIDGVRAKSGGSKARYVSQDRQIFIEDLVLEHYSKQGYKGIFSENQYWWNIMGVLFWNVIFANIPDVYISTDMPVDLFTEEFYIRRAKIIDDRISNLTGNRFLGLRKPNIEKELRSSFKRYYGQPCRPIEWGSYSVEQLSFAPKTLADGQLVAIMLRLLKNFNEYRRGLPDLFLMRDKELLFVEVKAENEKVADHQYDWLEFLKNIEGLSTEICRVRS